MLFRVAASLGILVIGACLSYLIYDNTRLSKTNNNITQTTSELQETEIYYTKQINKGLEQIQLLKLTDQKQKTAILSDLNSMDKNYDQLKNDLKDNPDDERLVHAIIKHYQIKLEAIDQVINSISFSQNNLKPQS
jgi:predicted PurR-regulated permease PerM